MHGGADTPGQTKNLTKVNDFLNYRNLKVGPECIIGSQYSDHNLGPRVLIAISQEPILMTNNHQTWYIIVFWVANKNTFGGMRPKVKPIFEKIALRYFKIWLADYHWAFEITCKANFPLIQKLCNGRGITFSTAHSPSSFIWY